MILVMVKKSDGEVAVQARDEEHARSLAQDMVNRHGADSVRVRTEGEEVVIVPAAQYLEVPAEVAEKPPARKRKK